MSEGWSAVKNSKKLHYFTGTSRDSLSLCEKYFWSESIGAFIKGKFSEKSYCPDCNKQFTKQQSTTKKGWFT
jgi:hypothetical protein